MLTSRQQKRDDNLKDADERKHSTDTKIIAKSLYVTLSAFEKRHACLETQKCMQRGRETAEEESRSVIKNQKKLHIVAARRNAQTDKIEQTGNVVASFLNSL